MKKPVPKTDDEWADAIADEAVRQIIETPDADAVAGKWPPLVQSVTGDDADKR